MNAISEDFEAYTGGIWNNEEVPDYAYFCWRWDEKYRRGGAKGPYPRVNDPKADKDFKHDVLRNFVEDEKMYHIQIETSKALSQETSPVAMLLWDTYGDVPTELLSMWKWAKTSDAFSICACTDNAECARPSCAAWNHYCKKEDFECMAFEADPYCQGAAAKILAELDPSLIYFHKKLWKDVADRDEKKLVPVWFHRFGPSKFFQSLQHFFSVMYDELVSETITDAIETLQILKNPNVSFLVTDEERAGRDEPGLNVEQNRSQLPLVLFAVAGSGKTQSVFNVLAVNWGYYLISGQISDSLAHQDSILESCRGGASADTRWLFELFQKIKAENNELPSGSQYSGGIFELLANRQTLMNRWFNRIDTNLGGAEPRHWLLFQTTCTRRYDPFIKTLKLRMLSPQYSTLDSPIPKMTSLPQTVMDEAQNELDPFWKDQPPLINFMEATSGLQSTFAVSGTSLRIKDCRELICKAGGFVTQDQHVEDQICTLLKVFRNVMDPQQCYELAQMLVDRVLKACTDESAGTQSNDISAIASTNILGDFYFTKELQKAKQAKDESTRKLLEEQRDFLIPALSSYHKKKLEELLQRNFDAKKCPEDMGPINYDLRVIFTAHHQRIWNWDGALPPPDDSRAGDIIVPQEYSFLKLLREVFASRSLNLTPNISFPLILSDDCFSTLLDAHIKRLLRRIGYFCSLGDNTISYEFWRIACPRTMVFQNAEDTDGRKTFFHRAETLLRKHVSAESRTACKWQCAADDAAEEFRQAFEENARIHDATAERRRCGIIRHSALFRGRMRWSIVYIEHVFASYLNSPNKPFPIEEKAKNAANFIKSSLKQRIQLLKSKSHYSLLKDLYFTAIRADLMHKPSIFPRDTSARMITEGFALLEADESRHTGSTYAFKQKLSEPIVVETVIEYLRDIESDCEDNFENVLRNLLLDNQDDASSFGKAAEYYFAWSLGGLFAPSSDGLDPSLKARESFRRKIAQAKFIPTESHTHTQVLGNIQGYDEYILEEPPPGLQSDLTLGSTLEFHEWLCRVEDAQYFPTFHFPSTHAGPDIVFSLKSRLTRERILCAFQIKTGEKCDQSDTFKLVRTLDPRLWFWNAPKLREDLMDALESWKSHRILTALVITSRPCIDFFASESDLYDGMKELQSHIQNWELCRELNFSKAYKDLKSEVNKLGNTASLSPKAISNLEKAKSLAEEVSQNIKDSANPDSTTFAKALVHIVEATRQGLENAAKSIYKAPGKRNDNKLIEPSDTPMPDYEKDGTPSPPHDRRDNGYYFVILDDIVLQSFLGTTFFHLCKAMKEVEQVKRKNLVEIEEDFEGHEFQCPEVGCKKNRIPFKRKAYFDMHMQNKHPEAKRRKLDSSVVAVGNGNGAENSDGEDEKMA